jgi:hypothetical protein
MNHMRVKQLYVVRFIFILVTFKVCEIKWNAAIDNDFKYCNNYREKHIRSETLYF